MNTAALSERFRSNPASNSCVGFEGSQFGFLKISRSFSFTKGRDWTSLVVFNLVAAVKCLLMYSYKEVWANGAGNSGLVLAAKGGE